MTYQDVIRSKTREIERRYPTKEQDEAEYQRGQAEVARMIDNERAFRVAGQKVS